MTESRDDGSDSVEQLRQALAAVPRQVLLEALAPHVNQPDDGDPPSAGIRVSFGRSDSFFSGPLPPPEILRQYDEAHAGLADRIVSMAESEQSHRHSVESAALQGSIDAEKRGQNYALLLCVLVILASCGLIWNGNEVSGTILAGGTLAALAYVFITGRRGKGLSESADGKSD